MSDSLGAKEEGGDPGLRVFSVVVSTAKIGRGDVDKLFYSYVY
jgi:hypothetical protein